jgi:hypothetical protein
VKGKPNLDNFLAGGAAAAAERPASGTSGVVQTSVLASQRRTKSIRIDPVLDLFLKEEAFRRTMASGKRVSESDLIEEALVGHFKIQEK